MIDIDLMLFDVDGTLIDSRKDIVNAINTTLKKLNFPEKPFELLISYIGKGVRDLLRRSLDTNDESLIDTTLPVFEEYYKKHSTDETKPYPNVMDILEYYKDKKKVVVTNRNKEYAEVTLGLLGLDKYFEDIIGGDDEKCAKPNACPLNKMLDTFNADKDKAIMIGDMDVDIMAGKNAGVYTCGVTYGIGKKEDLIKINPDYLINDISELKNIVK